MKSAIVLSLVLALSLSASTVVAQANTEEAKKSENVVTQTTKLNERGIVEFKKIPEEITGVIQEISENEMKVKAQDGEVYLVPLGLFSMVEGFKDLELKKDVKVTLKSLKPEMPKNISVGSATAGVAFIKELDEADLINVDPKKLDSKKIAGEKLDAIKVYNGNAVAIKENASENILMATIDSEKVFFANEITANGKTVKIDLTMAKQVMVRPIQAQPAEIKGTVETITDSDMTVKADDGKTYFVPLAKFSTSDEFKELGLKQGTEVVIKSGDIFARSAAGEKAITTLEGEKGAVVTSGNVKNELVIKGNAKNVFVFEGTVDAIASPGVPDIKCFDISSSADGKMIYIAGEITANGKTVKLPN